VDIVIILVIIVGLGIWYGFGRILDKTAQMGHDEMDYLADAHYVGIANRRAKLNEKLNDESVVKATELEARLKALREGK